MERGEYYKSVLEVKICFDEEKEKFRQYKTAINRGKAKQNIAVELSEASLSLESELKTRETELHHFRTQTQNAIMSPLLTQASVKKTENLIAELQEGTTSSFTQPVPKNYKFRFQKAVKIVTVLCAIYRGWKRFDYSFLPGEEITDLKRIALTQKRKNTMKFDTRSLGSFKSKLQEDTRDCLKMHPKFRSKSQERKVATFLKNFKFFHFFPEEKEGFICRNIGYEHYEPGRVIFLQNGNSERFYFVVSGLIAKVKTLHLAEGIRKLYHGDLHQGNTTEVDEVLNTSRRGYSLICKSDVEVLLLEKADLIQIFKADTEESIKYLLKGIDTFQTYPLQSLFNDRAVFVKFYAKGVTIATDISDSPYIYIVKTGICKIYVKRNNPLKEKHKSMPEENLRNGARENNRRNETKSKQTLQNMQEKYFQNDEFVQINIMIRGSICGLKSLLPRVYNKVQSITSETVPRPIEQEEKQTELVSDGAECLLLNKTKFLKHSDFCTLSKLLNMHNERSEETSLEDVKRWKIFKEKLVADVTKKRKK